MAKSKLMPLYKQVACVTEREIETGRFGPGEKIYSIREMCQQFGVADRTAKRALRELTLRGLVRPVHGSGVFVTDRAQQAEDVRVKQVAFVKIGRAYPIYEYEIDLIGQELRRLGYSMLYTVVSSEDETPEVAKQFIDSGVGCLLLFPAHRAAFEDLPYVSELRRIGIPMLVIETRSQSDSYVAADIERSTAELTEYLYQLGHRRICLASGFRRKAAGFKQAITQLRDPELVHWIRAQAGETEEDEYRLADEIAALDPRPTAVIAQNDRAAAILIRHFRQTGLGVPEDISVAAFDDHPVESKRSPVPVTVKRHPCAEVAQEVGKWVSAQLGGNGSVRRTRCEITSTLIVRQSTGPPVGSV